MNRFRRPTALLLWITLGLCSAATSAYAQECPDEIPSASSSRRAMAKDWFSRAEAADAANDPISAVRAYRCSLKMVPHGFTAFNLGRLAERTGDLELAVDAFNTYLKLAPEAPDRAEIRAKIAALGTRIEAMRNASVPGQVDPQPAVPVVPAVPVAPEPPLEIQTPPPSSDSNVSADLEVPISPRPSPSETQLAPWIVGGVGVAALAAGVAFNVNARSKMTTCRSLAAAGQEWEGTCNSGRTRAYASYALFGVAAAAAVTDGVLLFLLNEKPTERRVAATPLPGGAAVYGRFRF